MTKKSRTRESTSFICHKAKETRASIWVHMPVAFNKDIDILGMTIASGLTFINHVKYFDYKGGGKFSLIRRIPTIQNPNSITAICKS